MTETNSCTGYNVSVIHGYETEKGEEELKTGMNGDV